MDWRRISSRPVVSVALGATVLVVLALGIVLVKIKAHSVTCDPIDEYPWDKRKKLANHPSQDFTALAKFGGSLLIQDATGQRYLPIIVDSVSSESWGNKWTLLNMKSNCAELVLRIDGRYLNTTIRQIVVEADVGEKSPVICTARVEDVSFYKYSHYACNKVQSYRCYPIDSERVFELIVDEVEFEIDGDVDVIRRGDYSKEKYDCSAATR